MDMQLMDFLFPQIKAVLFVKTKNIKLKNKLLFDECINSVCVMMLCLCVMSLGETRLFEAFVHKC